MSEMGAIFRYVAAVGIGSTCYSYLSIPSGDDFYGAAVGYVIGVTFLAMPGAIGAIMLSNWMKQDGIIFWVIASAINGASIAASAQFLFHTIVGWPCSTNGHCISSTEIFWPPLWQGLVSGGLGGGVANLARLRASPL